MPASTHTTAARFVTRARMVLLVASFALAATGVARAQGGLEGREYEIKVAFLYNFTQFVEWPADSSHADAFTVCLLGESTAGDSFEALAGKEVGGQTLAVRRLNGLEDAADCRLLFVGASGTEQNASMLDRLADQRILTVGESEHFTEKGGIIRFFKARNKIRFEVNLEAARRAGLKISSQMLKVARIV